MWRHALRLAQECADDLFDGAKIKLPFAPQIETGELSMALPDHLDFRR
jgi:hypothetical protein